jgi:hypothetical protein
MMRCAIIRLLSGVLAVFAALVSCSPDRVAGGSGTETVNSYALLADSKPAGGAIVHVIDPQWWLDSVRQKASPVLQRAVADDKGRFSLSLPDRARPYNLQIDHSGQGLFVESATLTDLNDDTVRLEPFASYTGSFATGHDISQMNLSGSAYQASVGSEGTFFFTGVAPGRYTIVGISGAPSPFRLAICGSIALTPGSRTVDSALNGAYQRLLIDHFESGFGPTALGGIAPELWWYTVSDSGMYYWKRSSNSWKWAEYAGGHSFTSLDTIAGENGGTALRFVAVLDSTVAVPIATAGIFLKDFNKNGLDFSGMTGSSFRARGKGTVRIRFETAGLDTISLLLSAWSYPLKLTDEWTSRSISVDSLRILDPVMFPTLYPWSRESKNVLRIEFEFSKNENPLEDTLFIELDDLVLDGVGVEALQRNP